MANTEAQQPLLEVFVQANRVRVLSTMVLEEILVVLHLIGDKHLIDTPHRAKPDTTLRHGVVCKVGVGVLPMTHHCGEDAAPQAT